jgi:hypothetical protein
MEELAKREMKIFHLATRNESPTWGVSPQAHKYTTVPSVALNIHIYRRTPESKPKRITEPTIPEF